jgi:hypothetical protein
MNSKDWRRQQVNKKQEAEMAEGCANVIIMILIIYLIIKLIL